MRSTTILVVFGITAGESAFVALHAVALLLVLSARITGHLGFGKALVALALVLFVPVVGPLVSIALTVGEWRDAHAGKATAALSG